MVKPVSIETHFSQPAANPSSSGRGWTTLAWLQGITIVWMLVEAGLSLLAAARAHSPAMLAFGSDSVVELLSAAVVVWQFAPRVAISERNAGRAAGALLIALGFVVGAAAV